jgi:uncharacterized protein with PQ loop repeat
MTYIAQQIFGYLALVFWSFQLVPQAWKNYKNKSAEGLSAGMLWIWIASSVFVGVYCLLADLALPLFLQPELFSFFTLICIVQESYYDRKWPLIKALSFFILVVVMFGGLQAAFYYIFMVILGGNGSL